MKRLLLATKDRSSNDQYMHELYSVFAGFLEIDTYCWEIEQEQQLPREITPLIFLLWEAPTVCRMSGHLSSQVLRSS